MILKFYLCFKDYSSLSFLFSSYHPHPLKNTWSPWGKKANSYLIVKLSQLTLSKTLSDFQARIPMLPLNIRRRDGTSLSMENEKFSPITTWIIEERHFFCVKFGFDWKTCHAAPKELSSCNFIWNKRIGDISLNLSLRKSQR